MQRKFIIQFLYFCKLYMFQANPQPIIRSSKLYIQQRFFFSNLYSYLPLSLKSSSTIVAGSSISLKNPDAVCRVWAPDDGRRIRLRHVEHCAEINELYKVASCWLCLGIHYPTVERIRKCPICAPYELAKCWKVAYIYTLLNLVELHPVLVGVVL
jgi:hypothetical protein